MGGGGGGEVMAESKHRIFCKIFDFQRVLCRGDRVKVHKSDLTSENDVKLRDGDIIHRESSF